MYLTNATFVCSPIVISVTVGPLCIYGIATYDLAKWIQLTHTQLEKGCLVHRMKIPESHNYLGRIISESDTDR
jgi:hypothetical protein